MKRLGKTSARRRSIVLTTLRQLERLKDELATWVDADRTQEIEADLRALRKSQRKLSLGGESSAMLPATVIEERETKLAAVARISGRDKIRARFVQGGSPGSGGQRRK
jgi:hypothetical protein